MGEAKIIIDRYPWISPEEYHQQRQELVQEEASLAFGADIVLSDKERIVNDHLMSLKHAELADGFENPFKFAPARHIFEVLDMIENSPLFKLIRQMPKGGLLHAHATSLANTEVIVRATYQEHLWQRGEFTPERGLDFRFSRTVPDGEGWELVQDIRKRVGDAQYDDAVRQKFSLYDKDPLNYYKTSDDVWSRFYGIFHAFKSMVNFKPFWESYFREVLQELHHDNVMYLEMRSGLPALYDLEGKTYSPEEVAEIYINITEEFKATHRSFAGTKLIYGPRRSVDDETLEERIDTVERVNHQYSNYVVGFDLTGQEEPGRPLLEMADKLLTLSPSVHFVFHAGETNWNGMETDENLIDAILLGSKRIGHGYALLKHPLLLEEVKRRGICVEINPISNQVLRLVTDFRNHPASVLFSTDFPLVLSSDDPAYWGATPLSHDFYIAFLGMASAHQDLRLLKKLALNSLHYSLMDDQEKQTAMVRFESSWQNFIDRTVQQLLAQ
ncbi:adenosine deaminase AGSA-like [Anopheles bellator]|uniref:adenosine deaminase AGSA-like n=1 Tax=Anopheles bellator TaxID=139047 RepID=UPI002647445F|nr:adenosine deaminase AGSA-like [Anopheles bellator]